MMLRRSSHQDPSAPAASRVTPYPTGKDTSAETSRALSRESTLAANTDAPSEASSPLSFSKPTNCRRQ